MTINAHAKAAYNKMTSESICAVLPYISAPEVREYLCNIVSQRALDDLEYRETQIEARIRELAMAFDLTVSVDGGAIYVNGKYSWDLGGVDRDTAILMAIQNFLLWEATQMMEVCYEGGCTDYNCERWAAAQDRAVEGRKKLPLPGR